MIWYNYIICYLRNLRNKRYSLFYLLTVTPNVQSDVRMKIFDRRAPESSVCLMWNAFVVRSTVENKWKVTAFSDSRATFNNRLVSTSMRSLIRLIFIWLLKKVCLNIKVSFHILLWLEFFLLFSKPKLVVPRVVVKDIVVVTVVLFVVVAIVLVVTVVFFVVFVVVVTEVAELATVGFTTATGPELVVLWLIMNTPSQKFKISYWYYVRLKILEIFIRILCRLTFSLSLSLTLLLSLSACMRSQLH